MPMDSLKCPITHELFQDPVIGSDGHTYEKENIIAWLRQNGESPLTREPMAESSLRPNHAVRQMIDELKSVSGQTHRFRLDVDVRKTDSLPIFHAFGKTIYKAAWIRGNESRPIVLLRIDGAQARKEASFFVHLSCHPHIVRTFGLVESEPNSVMLAQEYAEKGDLSGLLLENTFKPNRRVLLEIFQQIIDAMICLADNGIVHGDLACRNVLVFQCDENDPGKNCVKLTDFGLTRASKLFSVLDTSTETTMTLIPVRYAAPETLRTNGTHSSYSEKSDIYSMGVLMWEACSQGALPYSSIPDDAEVRRKKLSGELLTKPHTCNDDLWGCILKCFKIDPKERHTFKSLKQALMSLPSHRSSSQSHSDPNEKAGRFTDTKSANGTRMEVTCEFCKLLCPISQYNVHRGVCPARDDTHVKELTQTSVRSAINDTIPCEYCNCSYLIDEFRHHQMVCSENPSNIQALRISSNQPVTPSCSTGPSNNQSYEPVPVPRSNSMRHKQFTFQSVGFVNCEYCNRPYNLNDFDLHKLQCLENPRSITAATITKQQHPHQQFKPLAFSSASASAQSQKQTTTTDNNTVSTHSATIDPNRYPQVSLTNNVANSELSSVSEPNSNTVENRSKKLLASEQLRVPASVSTVKVTSSYKFGHNADQDDQHSHVRTRTAPGYRSQPARIRSALRSPSPSKLMYDRETISSLLKRKSGDVRKIKKDKRYS